MIDGWCGGEVETSGEILRCLAIAPTAKSFVRSPGTARISRSLTPQYAARSLELSLYRGVWRYLESISDSWKRGVAFYESLVVRMDCFIPGTASLLEQVDRTCEQPERSMPMAGLRRYRRSHTLDMIPLRGHHHV